MGKRVLFLHTGGTLGMTPRDPDQVLEPHEFGAAIQELVPEIEQLADVEAQVLFSLDSTDLGPTHWMELARAIHAARDRFDGVVITHGTDAMAYTASALSYVLRDLPFPVILTGSQRPLADVHTDGRANLIGAVDLALRDIPEVSIYFDGLLLRGNRALKSSTFAFGAFSSPNHPPLAEIGTGVRIVSPALRPTGDFRLEGDFDARISVVWLAPGSHGTTLRGIASLDDRAILLVAPGTGNVPVEVPAVADAIGALVDAGKVVAVGSQARAGSTDLSAYAGGRLAQDRGAIGIGDMTLEAAAVKLMYLAAIHGSAEEIRSRLQVPLAGEITVRSRSRP